MKKRVISLVFIFTIMANSSVSVFATGQGIGVIDIESNNYGTLALMSNGTVMAWGNNKYYQVGNGTQVEEQYPVCVPGLNNITHICLDLKLCYAVVNNEDVYVWGTNRYTNEVFKRPTFIFSLENIHTISSLNGSIAICLENGQEFSYGGFTSNLEEAVLGSGTYVIEEYYYKNNSIYALTSDRKLMQMNFEKGVYEQVENCENIKKLVGFKEDSEEEEQCIVYLNFDDELVISNKNAISFPDAFDVFNDLNIVDAAYFNRGTIVIITEEGKVLLKYLKDPYFIEIGEIDEPISIMIPTVSNSSQLPNCFIINKKGALYTFGSNFQKALGRDCIGSSSTPIKLDIANVKDIEASDTSPVFRRNGVTYGIVHRPFVPLHSYYSTSNSEIMASLIAESNNFDYHYKELPNSAFTQIVSHSGGFYAIDKSGNVFNWGDGNSANSTTYVSMVTSYAFPEDISDKFKGAVKKISTNKYLGLALTEDGKVYEWGVTVETNYQRNWESNVPKEVDVTLVECSHNVIDIYAGDSCCFAILDDGTVEAWGLNIAGQLGSGFVSNYEKKPVKLSDVSNVKKIVTQGDITNIITDKGELYQCGNICYDIDMANSYTSNIHKVLATPYKNQYVSNVKDVIGNYALLNNGDVVRLFIEYNNAYGTKVIDKENEIFLDAVDTLKYHSNNYYAIMKDGTMMAWGLNHYGLLGTGDYYSHEKPTKIEGIDNVKKVVFGHEHHASDFVTALTKNGEVYIWGSNINGVFDTGNTAECTLGKTSMNNVVKKQIVLQLGSYKMKTNSEEIAMDSEVLVYNDRTYVPVRYLAEGLGLKVEWDALTQTVSLNNSEIEISLVIGENNAIVNGKSLQIDESNSDIVPIIIEPGRTYLPIRFVSETLGLDVKWVAETKEIIIHEL